MLRPRLVVLVVLAVVAVVLVALGGAYASGGGGNGPNGPGSVSQGPTGDAVPATTSGMPPTAQVFYAVVNADGSLARGFKGVTSAKSGTGAYIVTFNHNVTGCAYTASVGLSGSSGTSAPGYATVVGRNGTAAAVFVDTYDTSGAGTNLGFHMIVAC